jgi:hypothetical protein
LEEAVSPRDTWSDQQQKWQGVKYCRFVLFPRVLGLPVFPLVEPCLVCRSQCIHTTTLECACPSLIIQVIPAPVSTMHNNSFKFHILLRFLLFLPLTYGHTTYTMHLIRKTLISVLWLLLPCCSLKTNSHTHTALLVLRLSCINSTIVRSPRMHFWKIPLNSAQSLEVSKKWRLRISDDWIHVLDGLHTVWANAVHMQTSIVNRLRLCMST